MKLNMGKIEYHGFAFNLLDAGNVYPEIIGIREGYDLEGPRSFRRICEYLGNPLDFEPDLDGILLHSKAKMTDFLHGNIPASIGGMFVSARLLETLSPFVDGIHQTFPATVLHRRRTFEFYWVHLCVDAKPFVSFSETQFWLSEYGGSKLEEIEIRSLNEYNDAVAKYGKSKKIKTGTIYLKDGSGLLPDLIWLGMGTVFGAVSNRICDLILANGYTGLTFAGPNPIVT